MTAAPFEAWYFAWLAIIPLWFFLHQNSDQTKIIQPIKGNRNPFKLCQQFWQKYQQQLTLSLLWGFGYQGLTLFWITGIHPMTWMGVPWFWSLCIAIICWVIITAWGMGIPLLWAMGMLIFQELSVAKNPPIWQSKLRRILYGAALWCGVEYLWSQSDLFWHFLAFSQSPHNLAILQLTKLSGFTTVSLAIALVNGCLAEFCLEVLPFSQNKKIPKLFLSLGITILISCHILGWSLFKFTAINQENPVKIGIIQGNIPNDIKLYTNGTTRAIANYTEGYQTLAQENLDLIITPETALPLKIETVLGSTSFYPVIRAEQIPIVLGSFGSENRDFTNSLFTLDAQGKILSRYNKQRLVPLGEYIPFEKILGKIIDRLSPLDAHLVRGQNPPVVQTPIGKAIMAICYESAYPEHFRRQTAAGGEYMIVASNDAHYSPTMPAQHHALDVMQAIANDRWTIRASNTGYSAVVSPQGQTVWISELNQFAIHADTIYLQSTKTPYVRWGNWLVKLCFLTIILSIISLIYGKN